MVQNGPIGKQAVKKEIGKFQKAVHRNLQLCRDFHIHKLCFEASQINLKLLHLLLRMVKFPVLCNVYQQSTAHNVPCAPAFGTVQGFQNLICGTQGILSGPYSLCQFLFLALQFCHQGLAFRKLPGSRRIGCLNAFQLFGKCLLILLFAALQCPQPGIHFM